MFKTKLIASACASALMVLAATTPVASAATEGWMINGALLTGTKALATTAATEENWQFSAAGVVATCTGATVNSSSPQIKAVAGGAAASVEFGGCSVNEHCTMPTTIRTQPVVVEFTLDGALADKAVFTPRTKNVFTTFDFTGAECALLGEQEITGKFSVLAPTGQDESTKQAVKAAVAVGSGELKDGSAGIEVRGSVLERLASGETWSFL